MNSTDNTPSEQDLVRQFGYQPKLERSIGPFSSFALSYSAVSITTGVFLVLPFLLTNAGPAGLWTWVISSIGAILIALIFADLVGRIPLAGYAYQWSSRLLNPHVGWFIAVFGVIGFGVGAAGTIYGVTPFFLTEFGIEVTRDANIAGALVLTAIVVAMNIGGVKLAARVNNAAVVTEIIGGVLLAMALLVYAIVHHEHSVTYLFTQQPGAHGAYWQSFVLAFLLGAFTFAGWELPADLAEETKNATVVAARSIILAIIAVAISGLILLVSYTYASPSVSTTLNAEVPVLFVIEHQWGATAADIINVVFLVSFFAACLLIVAGAARICYSLARDRMIPLWRPLQVLSKRHHAPAGALIGVGIGAAIMFTVPALISTDAVAYVIGTAAVGYNLVYASVALIFVRCVRRGTLPRQFGAFSLGKYAQPVGWAAAIWQIALVGILTLPNINQAIGLTTLGMVAVGCVWYLVYVRRGLEAGTIGPQLAPSRELADAHPSGQADPSGS